MTDMITTTTRLTASEFAQLPEQDGIVELIDGEVIYVPPSKALHGSIVMKLILALGAAIKTGELRTAPNSVFLDDYNVPEPDIFWVSPDNSTCKIADDGYWHGAPDLIIEVYSPSTGKRDRREKFDLYERHGVREYWLVDPEAPFIEMFVLHEGVYQRRGVYGTGDTFESPTLALKLEANQFLGKS